MGIDIYLCWTGKTKKDWEKQYTGFKSCGKVGYLRGAYFGGYAGVLEYLFGWADWSKGKISFGPRNQKKFEERLNQLKLVRANRPSTISSNFLELPIFLKRMGFNVSLAGEGGLKPLTKEEVKEYEDFLRLARKLTKRGKKFG